MSKHMPVSNKEAIHVMNTVISYCRFGPDSCKKCVLREVCYNPDLSRAGFGFCDFLEETEYV